jgi:hypothetical protein
MSTTPYFLRNPAYDDQAQQPVTMAPAVEPQGMAAPVIQHPMHAMVAPIVGAPKLSAMAAPVDAGPEPAAMSPADAATMAPAPSAALPSTKQPTVRTMSPIERREDVLQQGMAKKPEGFMGKLGHGLGMAGRIAGDIFAPAETELVVQGLGKEGIGPRANEFRNKEMQELEAEKSKEGLEGAQASKAQADVPFVESETAKNEAGLPYVAPTAEADIAEKNAQAENLKNPRPKNDFELWFQHNPTGTAEQYQQLLSKPLSPDDAASRNAVWDRIAEQYHLPKGQFRAGMPTADAAALAASLNNVIARGQGAQSISIRMADEGAKGAVSMLVPVDPKDPSKGSVLQRVMPGQTIGAGAMTPGGMGAAANASRQDVRFHDEHYVLPAEAKEQSYEISDHAYREYMQARQKGKELPTGAQSMVELSQHLATTFGSVKGARVTKDMIEQHLGARGVGDKAAVAVNSLINGDKLSSDQWDAYHDLIQSSRNASWGTAVKEAARKGIPINFLPPDLQSKKVNGVLYDMGQDGQYHARQGGK